MGINRLVDIGKSALFTAQQAIAVTGHNVANVNTPGFSRQQVTLAENRPENGSPGQIGTGVHAESIRRAFDSFVEAQLLASRERLGEFTASSNALARLEPMFGDANNQGIGAGLNEFFGALQDVATNPSDLSARTVFLSKAQALVSQFNQSAAALTDAQQSIDRQVGQTITDVNRLTSQIAALNTKIAAAESSGQQANDLRDERGVALANLGELIEVSSIEDATGQLTVLAGRGQTLVDKERTYQLVGVPDLSNNGLLNVHYDAGAGPTTNLTPVIQSGRLKGLLDVRDQTISSLRASLDTMASELVTQVNQQHRLGFGLDGSTSQDFFVPIGTTAGTIAVSLTNVRQIAASSTAAGVPGNNANALALAGLRSTAFASLGNVTYQEYYSTIAGSFGSTAQGVDSNLKAQVILHDRLTSQRASVSGVSMDEELANLLQYQRSFEAASRMIVVADELFQTILSMKR
ncbi:MAG TPA: flagellar hook-associated protein FlgK [Nitrospiraceae bacterium]|nr:flagellar hook-associated protein FlgK [Nitrospiraceae bacterium]